LKLITFKEERIQAGAVIGNSILNISAVSPFMPTTVDDILKRGLLPEVQNLVDNASEIEKKFFRPLSEIELFCPIIKPSKIICLGLNYKSHALEQGKKPPEYPIIFAKAPTALVGPNDDIVIKPWVTHVDAEAELAVVIGAKAKDVDKSHSMNYVAGYTVFNDVTARKFQKLDGQWFRAKSFDSFAPCGPWLVSKDEVVDPQNLSIMQKLNGKVMQNGNTSDMIFSIPEIISYISSVMTLLPGDIIATGTPSGVGVFRDPKIFLKDGDIVEVEIEHIGKIRNKVKVTN